MFLVELSSLLRSMNQHCYGALESAAVMAQSRRHPEVEIAHLVSKLLEEPASDVPKIFSGLQVPLVPHQRAVRSHIDKLAAGKDERPEISPYLATLVQDAWLIGSLEYRATQVRSGHLLLLLLRQAARYKVENQPALVELLKALDAKAVRAHFDDLVRDSCEQPLVALENTAASSAAGNDSSDSALKKYTYDLTADARNGRIDEVTGRDDEIGQLISILSRRRKNNPLIVGEAGVGKTALVEGLALRIARGEVQGWLAEVSVRSLDLGLLQAGAGLRGEFESRLTSIIAEIQSAARPIILFIDEAHMLIGSGNQAGGSDAANLLKPALARGDLRTIAATTWTEYQKIFEKDAALRRRFQMVKVSEPSVKTAVEMLERLVPRYEQTHGVHIRRDSLTVAVELSSRYLTGRQLPDKAVDLMDRCAAYVKLHQANKPGEQQRKERELEALQGELEARRRDRRLDGLAVNDDEEITRLLAAIEKARGEHMELTRRYEAERQAVDTVLTMRRTIGGPDSEPAPEDAAKLREALSEVGRLQKEVALVPLQVDRDVVAAVIAEETNIPIGRLVSDESTKLEQLEQHMGRRVKGQNDALRLIADRIRSARLQLQDERRPVGVFLLVGPSGTGKTETALSVAELLFGGEQFLTTINMSEYLDRSAVSRLVGAAPGLIGYEEGGVLTEAVRQRPYSAVLLDEVEKAEPVILNLFYQVFDRGMLSDGQKRLVDFRNTVVFLTSNLGSRITMEATKQGTIQVPQQELRELLTEKVLRDYFSPALLARMTVIPYYPLSRQVLAQVLTSKLDQIRGRVQGRYGIALQLADRVEELLLSRCNDAESGARVLDHLTREELVPSITRYVMTHLGAERPRALEIGLDEAGRFTVAAAS